MKLRNKLFIASAAAAAVGFVSASAAVAAPTAPHTAVQQMRWVGVHPDTSADAPAGKEKVYVIDIKQNTIKYIGLKPRRMQAQTVNGPYNPPNSGNFVYGTCRTPYSNYGFTGSGTKQVNLAERGYVETNNYSGSAQWRTSTGIASTPHLGKHSTATITGCVTGSLVALD